MSHQVPELVDHLFRREAGRMVAGPHPGARRGEPLARRGRGAGVARPGPPHLAVPRRAGEPRRLADAGGEEPGARPPAARGEPGRKEEEIRVWFASMAPAPVPVCRDVSGPSPPWIAPEIFLERRWQTLTGHNNHLRSGPIVKYCMSPITSILPVRGLFSMDHLEGLAINPLDRLPVEVDAALIPREMMRG